MAESTQQNSPARLRKVLGLWDLVFYGMVLIQPTAGVPLFGVAQKLSNGHTVTTILIAMFAMMITAVSYGRMAALYPSAGSAYTYVGRTINPHLGFMVGWAMLLDYILQPLINVVWISAALHSRYIAEVPFPLIALGITAFITALNLIGIRSSARMNKLLLMAMCVVIAVFLVMGVHFLYHQGQWAALFSIAPFYTPATFSLSKVWGATSFAALTYIGFDGITTLSEDVENPRRNVMLATVLVCLLTGLLAGAQTYLGQRIWPDWHTFPNLETAFMDICRRVGGPVLFEAMGVILILAALGSALTGGVGAARLLFGMGRDGVLPRRFFAHLHAETNTPTYNILLIGAVAWLGAVALNYVGSAYEHAGELLNFGAFLAFMGVNLSSFWHFSLLRKAGKPRVMADIVLPLTGFVFCASIWWNLNILAKVVGGVWFAVGLIWLAATTSGFRQSPKMIDFSEG
ncbi:MULTISPECIES: APC family permease [Acidobacterium]|uniref:APC transporter, cationic amino acid transporter (CAT) family n=1 Tax=Acidobacterium capsulatum (strain ATCC 51196 / DSM 11244 / BCRC 80197 / JCM 7670 / NBRC 15755 / NCIMB 13165 / 161) TaxID=240015 RepID=C1F593_ACIC5|nr:MULTISPECIES: APC family permease [Acidobacterium]ACO31487.1 APC transporter, cationic amino acid transporter (CAT) family [Acidobacterium capsulatum ATCC 51196]HCT59557.1 APC family permease [Acidobacterium sp.]